MSGPELRAIRLQADDPVAAGSFLASVCGSLTEKGAGHGRTVPLQGAALEVGPKSTGRGGSSVIGVVVDRGDGGPTTRTVLNGIEVETRGRSRDADGSAVASSADVVLDHVAIVVEGLDASAQAWSDATGARAEMIGIHPVSNGTLLAARLELGSRMIELLAPVPGTSSAMGDRLATAGEGAMALALPAVDLNKKLEDLRIRGIRTIHQDPHWLVHPANPARLMVQLTPRVKH